MQIFATQPKIDQTKYPSMFFNLTNSCRAIESEKRPAAEKIVEELEGKGLIEESRGEDSPPWTGMQLTEAGIEKAIELELRKY